MAIEPVQLIVLAFNEPNFQGEVLAELDRLKENDVVRVIDAIVVHKDAQKTDARQTNKNLLLSENAVVNTKPQLEIYADDVKCSHGSSIGQLDADALFYLRSRGLGLDDARSLLSFAFASDVVGRMKIEGLRRRLDDYLVERFSQR